MVSWLKVMVHDSEPFAGTSVDGVTERRNCDFPARFA